MFLNKIKWAALAAVSTGFVFTSAAVLGRQESQPGRPEQAKPYVEARGGDKAPGARREAEQAAVGPNKTSVSTAEGSKQKRPPGAGPEDEADRGRSPPSKAERSARGNSRTCLRPVVEAHPRAARGPGQHVIRR